jgi:hypothetical protein
MAPKRRNAKSRLKKPETLGKAAADQASSKAALGALKKVYGPKKTRELLENLLLEEDYAAQKPKKARNVKGKKPRVKQAGAAAKKRLPRVALYDKLDDIFREAQVPAHRRDDLKQWFIGRVRAVVDNENKPSLPDKAPELWQKGQGEKALKFLSRVYKPYLEAQVLTYAWLSEKDYPLYQAVQGAARRVRPDDNQLLPLTESEVLDMEFKTFVDLYGQDELERIHTVMSTLKHREHRHRKKSGIANEYNLSKI